MDVPGFEGDELRVLEPFLLEDALLASKRVRIRVKGHDSLAAMLLASHLIVQLLGCFLDKCVGKFLGESALA